MLLDLLNPFTAKNTVISPDFLMWKFCGKVEFLHSFGRIARNYAETVLFSKISTPGSQVKLRYFLQSFGPNALFLYHLKTSENRKVFSVLSDYPV